MAADAKSSIEIVQPLKFIWQLEWKDKYNVFLNELNELLPSIFPEQEAKKGMFRNDQSVYIPPQARRMGLIKGDNFDKTNRSLFLRPGPSQIKPIPVIPTKQLVDVIDVEQSNLLYLSPHLQLIHDALNLDLVFIQWKGMNNPQELAHLYPEKMGTLLTETLHYGNINQEQLEMTAILFIAHIVGDVERKGIVIQEKYTKTLQNSERARIIIDPYGILVVFKHEEVYYSFPLGTKKQIPNDWLHKAYFICWLADQLTFVNQAPGTLPTLYDLFKYQHPLEMFMRSLDEVLSSDDPMKSRFDVEERDLIFKMMNRDKQLNKALFFTKLIKTVVHGSDFQMMSEERKKPHLMLKLNQEKFIGLDEKLPFSNQCYLLSRLAWFGYFPENYDDPDIVPPDFVERLRLSAWMARVKIAIICFPVKLPNKYCGKGISSNSQLAVENDPLNILFIPWSFPKTNQKDRTVLEYGLNDGLADEYDFGDNLLYIRVGDDLPLTFQRFWNKGELYTDQDNPESPFLKSLAEPPPKYTVFKQRLLSRKLSFSPYLLGQKGVRFIYAPVQVIIGTQRFYVDPYSLIQSKNSQTKDLIIKLLCRMSSWDFLKPYSDEFSTMYQTIALTDPSEIQLFYDIVIPKSKKQSVTMLIIA